MGGPEENHPELFELAKRYEKIDEENESVTREPSEALPN